MTKIYRETIQLKDVKLFYYDTKEVKPVIICLHGMFGRAETWSDFICNYASKYRVIALDLRGHGFSSKPDGYYTIDEMGEDVREMMQKLQIEQAILVGHSMGGGVAGYLAANSKELVKAVAILDKSAKGPNKHNLILSSQIKEKETFTKDWKDVFDTRKEALECIKGSSGSELETQYFINSLYEDTSGYRFLFSKEALAAYRANYYDWMDLLPQISCRTLLVKSSGEDSVSTQDFNEMKSCLKNVLTYTMSNTNHNLHLADTDEFYKVFDQFLESID